MSVGDGSGSWVATALLVSTNYFTPLGVAPHAGQLISPAWNVAADPPAVPTHDTWLARFGGDRCAIGQSIRVSGGTFRIAAVRAARIPRHPARRVPICGSRSTTSGAFPAVTQD